VEGVPLDLGNLKAWSSCSCSSLNCKAAREQESARFGRGRARRFAVLKNGERGRECEQDSIGARDARLGTSVAGSDEDLRWEEASFHGSFQLPTGMELYEDGKRNRGLGL
jgi:hypothetical protein